MSSKAVSGLPLVVGVQAGGALSPQTQLQPEWLCSCLLMYNRLQVGCPLKKEHCRFKKKKLKTTGLDVFSYFFRPASISHGQAPSVCQALGGCKGNKEALPPFKGASSLIQMWHTYQ